MVVAQRRQRLTGKIYGAGASAAHDADAGQRNIAKARGYLNARSYCK